MVRPQLPVEELIEGPGSLLHCQVHLLLEGIWVHQPLNLLLGRCWGCWSPHSPVEGHDRLFTSLLAGPDDLVDDPAAALAEAHHLADRDLAPLELELALLLSSRLVQEAQDLPDIGVLRFPRRSVLAHVLHLSRKFINGKERKRGTSHLKNSFIIFIVAY